MIFVCMDPRSIGSLPHRCVIHIFYLRNLKIEIFQKTNLVSQPDKQFFLIFSKLLKILDFQFFIFHDKFHVMKRIFIKLSNFNGKTSTKTTNFNDG